MSCRAQKARRCELFPGCLSLFSLSLARTTMSPRKSSSGGTQPSSSTPYQLQSNNNAVMASGKKAIVYKLNSMSSDASKTECLEEEDDDHPEYYLSKSVQNRIDNDSTLTEEDKMIIQRLACRKFHVPGHTFWQDYIYW